jgi:hypothetical protein
MTSHLFGSNSPLHEEHLRILLNSSEKISVSSPHKQHFSVNTRNSFFGVISIQLLDVAIGNNLILYSLLLIAHHIADFKFR